MNNQVHVKLDESSIVDTPQYYSRSIDYLGDLGARLRDQKGFSTLIHELIQNANDAKCADNETRASKIRFNICDEHFMVDNDGIFSDCGYITEYDCPWASKSERGHMCDFHRFRRIASGDKRQQKDTTGAFGIGFISVLQITDQPELISNGRHWILQELEREDKRIKECRGCDQCRRKDLPGTRFIFPWANDKESELRAALKAEALTKDDIVNLMSELKNTLPTALLFLKYIEEIELCHNNEISKKFSRVEDGETLIINDGQRDALWYLLKGNFAESARDIYNEHKGYFSLVYDI